MSLADDVLDRAAELRERGETFVVATVVRVDPPTSARPGDKALIAADGTLWGWIGGSCSESLVRREALHAMGDGQPRLVKIAPDMAPEHEPGVVAHISTCPSAGSLDVFIDPHMPRPVLLVIGDTPAAHTLVRLGATIGYETCAVHPGALASDFPEADRVIGSLDLAPAKPGATTWAAVATMGHYDEEAIEALLPYDVAYIGLVASRKRAATVLAVLNDRGNQGLDRVRRAADSSVGGSQEEIALAVLAEIVAERHAHQPSYTIVLPATAIDPMCGMSVEIKGAMHTLVMGDTTHYFCGAGCLDAFKVRPR
jgi:xanthine dehydrogenase accessory factor